MPRHPLFPPVDPPSGKRPASKGHETRSTLTANGRVQLRRRRWACATTVSDWLVDQAQATVSLGVRQLCCLLNGDAPSFARAAAHLLATTGIRISAELLRQTVQSEGKRVLACCDKGELPCPPTVAGGGLAGGDRGISRLYLGCDGFHVGLITDLEKRKRRAAIAVARAYDECGSSIEVAEPLGWQRIVGQTPDSAASGAWRGSKWL